MEKNVFETLSERGFIKQVTHEGLEEMLGREKVSFYIGFDPTADSLHVGHFVALMAMAHSRRFRSSSQATSLGCMMSPLTLKLEALHPPEQ